MWGGGAASRFHTYGTQIISQEGRPWKWVELGQQLQHHPWRCLEPCASTLALSHDFTHRHLTPCCAVLCCLQATWSMLCLSTLPLCLRCAGTSGGTCSSQAVLTRAQRCWTQTPGESSRHSHHTQVSGGTHIHCLLSSSSPHSPCQHMQTAPAHTLVHKSYTLPDLEHLCKGRVAYEGLRGCSGGHVGVLGYGSALTHHDTALLMVCRGL